MENKEYIHGFNDGFNKLLLDYNTNAIINDIKINFEAKIKELNEQIEKLKKEKQPDNKIASSLDMLIDYKIDGLFESIVTTCILSSGDISPEDNQKLFDIIYRFIISNNQTEWGYSNLINTELKENFIEVTRAFAIQYYNQLEVYGLYDDGKSEGLIEELEDIERFDRYVIEKGLWLK